MYFPYHGDLELKLDRDMNTTKPVHMKAFCCRMKFLMSPFLILIQVGLLSKVANDFDLKQIP